jgi:hypothetical protein
VQSLTANEAFAKLGELPVQPSRAGFFMRAEVAELADAHGSGPCTRKGVGVRVPSSAPDHYQLSCIQNVSLVNFCRLTFWLAIAVRLRSHFRESATALGGLAHFLFHRKPVFTLLVYAQEKLPKDVGVRDNVRRPLLESR